VFQGLPVHIAFGSYDSWSLGGTPCTRKRLQVMAKTLGATVHDMLTEKLQLSDELFIVADTANLSVRNLWERYDKDIMTPAWLEEVYERQALPELQPAWFLKMDDPSRPELPTSNSAAASSASSTSADAVAIDDEWRPSTYLVSKATQASLDLLVDEYGFMYADAFTDDDLILLEQRRKKWKSLSSSAETIPVDAHPVMQAARRSGDETFSALLRAELQEYPDEIKAMLLSSAYLFAGSVPEFYHLALPDSKAGLGCVAYFDKTQVVRTSAAVAEMDLDFNPLAVAELQFLYYLGTSVPVLDKSANMVFVDHSDLSRIPLIASTIKQMGVELQVPIVCAEWIRDSIKRQQLQPLAKYLWKASDMENHDKDL
jgi:hypothetical protein